MLVGAQPILDSAGEATRLTTVVTVAEFSVAEICAVKSATAVDTMVNVPVEAPATMNVFDGTSNCTLSLTSLTLVVFWAGAVSVTVQFAVVPAANDAEPHVTADSCGVAVLTGVSLTNVFAETPFEEAVIWTSVLVSTAVDDVAVKVADAVPAAIVTDAGTFSWTADDAKATTAPEAGAGWDRLAIQVAFAGAISDEGLHDKDIVLTGTTTAIAPPVAVVAMA